MPLSLRYVYMYIQCLNKHYKDRIKYSVVGANKRRKTRLRARVQVVCLPFAVLPLIVRGSPLLLITIFYLLPNKGHWSFFGLDLIKLQVNFADSLNVQAIGLYRSLHFKEIIQLRHYWLHRLDNLYGSLGEGDKTKLSPIS